MRQRFAVGSLALSALAALAFPSSKQLSARSTRCTLMPGRVHLLLRVEHDTLLPLANTRQQVLSLSRPPVRPGAPPLADATTLMPSARVRLLQLDSATRAELAREGVRDSQPIAYIQAFSYGADCRPLAWTDTVPWALTGDEGYAVATLAPRSAWVDQRPIFVIAATWQYPYPRRRGLLFRVTSSADSIATPAALYDYSAAIAATDSERAGTTSFDLAMSASALRWARTHPRDSETEPIRSQMRDLVLRADMRRMENMPSRLRGTYRVTMRSDDSSATWWFRTVNKPAYGWENPSRPRSSAEIVAAPYAAYSLVGYAGSDSVSVAAGDIVASAMQRRALVWLGSGDRPSMPGNDRVRTIPASLVFALKGAPESIWLALEPFIPALSASDSAMFARSKLIVPRDQRQPSLPITLRVSANGAVSGDTTLVRDGRRLRVTLVRVDSSAVPRAW
jgi:hypothetical protein